jgi:malonyl-CoA O-methyltransferase
VPVNRVDKARVRAAFSRGAAAYDARAVAQRRARDRVAELLERHAPRAVRILDVGAGTGALAARLAAGDPSRRLALADLAPGMCAAARDALPGAPVVTADAEALPFPDGRFDAVVSSSTFQWLPRLEPALAEARRALAPGGTLVVALFAERTLLELREAWRAVAGAAGEARMHRFFRRDEVAAAIGVTGLAPIAVEEEEIVERHPDARAVLHAIRAIGASNAVPREAGSGLGGRRVTVALLDRYDRAHGGPDGVPATYHVVYAVARRTP